MSAIPDNRRTFKLWHVLVAILVIGAGVAMLPQEIGIPVLLTIEGLLITALIGLVGLDFIRRIRRR